MTGLFISLKMHYENVSDKEPIFADEGCDQKVASDSSGLSGGFRGIGRGFGL
jgi:hypothetical protein